MSNCNNGWPHSVSNNIPLLSLFNDTYLVHLFIIYKQTFTYNHLYTMIKLPSHLLFVLLTVTPSTINLVSAQGGACFKDRAELKYAVDSCWEGGKGHFSDDLHGGTELENDANEADCDAVKVKYGWPIGTWYVIYL